ncbi:MAG TPA: Ig-like domain-containing protein [Myxococcota bacterium]
MTRILLTLAALLLSSCDCSPALQPGAIIGDGFTSADAVDSTHVKVTFSRSINKDTAQVAAFTVGNYTVVPPASATVASAKADDDTHVTLETTALTEGVRYTLAVKGVKDAQGRSLDGTLNFTATGDGPLVPVTIEIDDVETARLHNALTALVTVAEDGSFSEQLVPYPMTDGGGSFTATLNVQLDPARTLDPGDDADTAADRRAYGVIVMDDAGRMASSLVTFVVDANTPTTIPVTVLPPVEIQQPQTDALPDPPVDANPSDGVRQVLVVVDDRASHELKTPQLKVAFSADGTFDSSFPQTLTLTPMDGENAGYWSAVVGVKVDPNRVATGSSDDTFPYFAFLVEGGVDYQALDVAITAPDETPVTTRTPRRIGAPTG